MKVDIYHEQQESLLCGQHCLNNLLQGAIFTAVDLAEIANELDTKERQIMGSPRSPHGSGSANVDDSGNFSLQVLRFALQQFNNLDLEPWFQREGEQDTDPLEQQGFIINRSSHWFTIRKINDRWWNLNSTSEKPELISQFYLSAFLHQLRAEDYSVFIVTGAHLPAHGTKDIYAQGAGQWYSEDDLLGTKNGTQQQQQQEVNVFSGTGHRLGGDKNEVSAVDQKDFQINDEEDDEEMMLAKAISASMESAQAEQIKSTQSVLSAKEEMRLKRLASLEKRGL